MQPDSHDDLDQTDELPRLDVAAYEASLARTGEDPLARTDTWAVGTLQETLQEAFQGLELVQASDESVAELPTRNRGQRPVISGSADLTINVDGLLKRITELETGIGAARTANAELENRCQSLIGDRAELDQRMQALQAENTRLTEHSSISYERAQRLEQQLRDQFAQHNTWLNETEASRNADRLKSEQERAALEQQLAQNAARMVDLQENHARLQDALNESIELAANRATLIAELQQSLAEEEDAAYGLGRNLAAKLADYDTLSSMVAQRNAAIASLEQARDELDRRLQQSIANADALALQLADANQRAAQSNELFSEQDREIEQRTRQLAALNAQIEQLTGELQATSQEGDSSRAALMLEKEQQGRLQLALAERTQEIAGLRESLQSTEASLATVQGELELASAARDELAARTAELASTTTELDSVRREAAAARTGLETQCALVHTREEALAAAQQTVADLQGAKDELQRALSEATHKIERLYAVSRDDTQLLTAKNAELAALQLQLEEQQPLICSLEHAIRARDTLVEDLRNEVRTVQDERTIMAGQLDKARLRARSMAQQVFQKDNRIATLKADLAVHTEALAAIRRDVSRVEGGPEALAADHSERALEPVDHEGDVIVLNRKVMTIGRTNDNDIFIPSKLISRHHARLLVGPNAVIVEDAGSTNGCYVNDQQIKQHVLREGDVLELGDLKFRLIIRAPTDTRLRANVISFNEGRRGGD